VKELTTPPVLAIFVVLMVGVFVRHLTYGPVTSHDILPTSSEKYLEILKELDKAMDVVSMDGLAPGGFWEWFMPRINEAREAGASEVEINLRLNRVWILAEKGKYFDQFLWEIDHSHPEALKGYIQFLKIP